MSVVLVTMVTVLYTATYEALAMKDLKGESEST